LAFANTENEGLVRSVQEGVPARRAHKDSIKSVELVIILILPLMWLIVTNQLIVFFMQKVQTKLV
jgi:hypothetical protein